jgi:hypothetical protein
MHPIMPPCLSGAQMLFTDLADPLTRMVLLLEAAPFGLAVAALFGVLVRSARWLARGLAALSVVVALLGSAVMVWEIWTLRPPLVLPGAPFGTYTQPTVLRLLPLDIVLVLIGGVFAFQRPGFAGLLFVASGVWGALNALNVLGIQDATSPPGTANAILVWSVLPALGVGALLLATWWRTRATA